MTIMSTSYWPMARLSLFARAVDSIGNMCKHGALAAPLYLIPQNPFDRLLHFFVGLMSEEPGLTVVTVSLDTSQVVKIPPFGEALSDHCDS